MAKKKEVIDDRVIMKPSPNCGVCWGRGWLRYIVPENNSREVRPCKCVKAKVKEWPDVGATAEQAVV